MTFVQGTPEGEVGWQETPARLGLYTVAAVAAGAFIQLVGVSHTDSSAAYAGSPAGKVQMSAFVALWAAGPTVWVVGRGTLHRVTGLAHGPLFSAARHRVIALAVALVVAAIAGGVGLFARGADTGLYLGLWRTMATYAFATFAAYPALLTMWRAVPVARELRAEPAATAAEAVPVLGTVRGAIVTALAGVGTLVSIGVFATGAQRQAWLAFSHNPDAYPPAFVILTGLQLTLLLAVNFFPAWSQWRAAATEEVNHRLPLRLPPAPGWQERTEARDTYSKLLQLPESLRDVASSAVAVLGPLMSAAVSLLLPTSS